jgi:hypothetical protein
MSEKLTLTDLEREAAVSYREWPVYIVMRLKRLQQIQSALRVEGNTPSQIIRRDELLKAAYDLDEMDARDIAAAALAEAPTAAAQSAPPALPPSSGLPDSEREVRLRDSGEDYYEEISYDDD